MSNKVAFRSAKVAQKTTATFAERKATDRGYDAIRGVFFNAILENSVLVR